MKIKDGFTLHQIGADTLTDFLMENYEVDSETAKRDAEQLIKNWLEAGIIK